MPFRAHDSTQQQSQPETGTWLHPSVHIEFRTQTTLLTTQPYTQLILASPIFNDWVVSFDNDRVILEVSSHSSGCCY